MRWQAFSLFIIFSGSLAAGTKTEMYRAIFDSDIAALDEASKSMSLDSEDLQEYSTLAAELILIKKPSLINKHTVVGAGILAMGVLGFCFSYSPSILRLLGRLSRQEVVVQESSIKQVKTWMNLFGAFSAAITVVALIELMYGYQLPVDNDAVEVFRTIYRLKRGSVTEPQNL